MSFRNTLVDLYIKNVPVRRMVSGTAISIVCLHAHAQSSVTLYGIADAGLSWSTNQGGHSAIQAISAGRGSSRWGFRGVEDLGGGLKTVFGLENGFNIVNGTTLQNGREFGRLAYVGLHGNFGDLTIGRQDDLLVRYLGPYSASVLFGGSIAAPADDVDNRYADFKFDNTIKYFSPVYKGFQLGALLGIGGVAGSVSENSILGVGGSYVNGPLSVSAVYRHIDNPAVILFDGASGATAGKAFANPVANPIVRGYASAQSLETYGGGASYTWRSSMFNLVYTETRFNDIVATSTTPFAGQQAAVKTAEASYDYNVSPTLLLGASYSYTRTENAHYGQWTLASRYLLSKRTFLYALASWQHASGTDSTGKPAVANLNLLSASSNANQAAVRFGIQQNF